MNVQRISPRAKLPTRKHPTDAGLDLYSIEDVNLLSGTYAIVKTGIKIQIPHDCVGWITNKSRNNFLVGGGIVDNGYEGEILVKLINPLKQDLYLPAGEAIAQLLVFPIAFPEVEEVTEFTESNSLRGVTGGIVTQLFNGVGGDVFQG